MRKSVILTKKEDKKDDHFKIIHVDKEFDFVIINAGKLDNMKEGRILEILDRNFKSLGKIKIEYVYDKVSACKFLPDVKKNLVLETLEVRPVNE